MLGKLFHHFFSAPVEEWAWRFGTIILAAVPAIIGGGIVWHFIPNWTAVFLWEIILALLLVIVLDKGSSTASDHNH